MTQFLLSANLFVVFLFITVYSLQEIPLSQGSQPLSVTAYSAWRCLISDLELSTEHLRKHSISNAMANVSVSSELFCIISDLLGHIWSKFMFLPHVGSSETIMQQGAAFFSKFLCFKTNSTHS